MDNVKRIAPQHKRLEAPAPLRELQGWLVWRYEHHAGESKPRKVPYYAEGGRRHGQQGSPVDRAKLVTFAAARAAASRLGMDGVGLAMLGDWGVTALDFDHCVDADGKLPPEIAGVAHRTYSEYSPSGTGIRVFLKGDLGNRKARAKDGEYGVETFTSTGFVTFTGNALPHVDLVGYEDKVADVDESTRRLCEARLAHLGQPPVTDDFMAGYERRLGLSVEEMEALLDKLDPDMDRDDWVRVGMALHHETEGDDTGFEMWNDWSALGGKYPSEEALRDQWDSFTRRMGPGRRQVTMASVIHMTKDATLRLEPSAEVIMARADALAQASEPEPAARPAGLATPEGFEGRFKIAGLGDTARRKSAPWWIKGVLPAADLGIIYGASGAGKSFVAFDMACALARGEPWFEHRVARPARVVVVVAEGAGGMAKRVRAYCQQHNLDPDTLPIGTISDAPNVLDIDDVTHIAAALRAVEADIIIWDTFAQVTPGANENAAEDMGRALANLRKLREVTGAMNVLIHHAGKDLSRGSRGWSGLKAAADVEIEVTRDEVNGSRAIRVGKLKDGEDGRQYGFRLERLVVGMDEDGDEETSCVVIACEAPVREIDTKSAKRRGRMQNHVLEMIATLGSRDAVPLADLVTLAADALPEPGPGERDTRRQVVTRAIQTLSREKDGPLAVEGGVVIFYE